MIVCGNKVSNPEDLHEKLEATLRSQKLASARAFGLLAIERSRFVP
jgi:hypothetical protein